MRHILITIAAILAFGLMSLAQNTAPSSQQTGTQSTNPTTGTSSTRAGQYGSQSSASGSTGQSSNTTASTKGEKKLKGCIESQGGQYVLREKNGNEVQLTGSADLASHVGHEVTVHGTYQGSNGASAGTSNEKMPSASGSPTANPNAGTNTAGQQFMVDKIDHHSSTCKMKGASSGSASSTSGTSSSGTQAPDHQ